MSDTTTATLRMATREDSALPAFDFTKLSAINTCPRWGILRYAMHRTMPGGGRTMALDAGKAMHECFSAVRLFQLGHTQGMMDHYEHHGARLFGTDRWTYLRDVASNSSGDTLTALRGFALAALDTAGYIEDPYDKRRSYVQLEEALLYYCQRWDLTRYPVWVRDREGPTDDIGIEIPFALVVTWGDGRAVRYTGRIDGIHHSGVDTGTVQQRDSERAPAQGTNTSPLLIGENKTASRLNDAWRASFDVNHQPTGYMAAASTYTGLSVTRCLVHGLSIPLPRRFDEGLATEDVRRYPHQFDYWLHWLRTTVDMHDKYLPDVRAAPMYTHSCNRYFRPCSMIPFCAATPTEQLDIVHEMVHDEWSPLQEEASKHGD